MRYEIIISIAAIADIEEAVKWYENQNLELGMDLKNSFYESLEMLKSNPFLCSKRYKEVRVKFIRRFPYGIHFIIVDEKIKVYGFFHMKRNPTKWLKGIK